METDNNPIAMLQSLERADFEASSFVTATLRYVQSGDTADLAVIPPIPDEFSVGITLAQNWAKLAQFENWGVPHTRLARVLIDGARRHLGSPKSEAGLAQLIRRFKRQPIEGGFHPDEILLLNQISESGADRMMVGKFLAGIHSDSSRKWGMDKSDGQSGQSPVFDSALESWIFEGTDQELASLLQEAPVGSPFARAVARFRPEVIPQWWTVQSKSGSYFPGALWPEIVSATDRFDEQCIEYAKTLREPLQRFTILLALWRARGLCRNELEKTASLPDVVMDRHALSWLLEHSPDSVPSAITQAALAGVIRKEDYSHINEPYTSAYRNSLERWERGGREMFGALRSTDSARLEGAALSVLLESPPPGDDWPGLVIRWTTDRKADYAVALWTVITEWIKKKPAVLPDAFRQELITLLGNRSSQLRDLAVECLPHTADPNTSIIANSWLEKGTVDQKLGAIALISRTDPMAASRLETALAEETRDKVRAALHSAITALGGKAETTPQSSPASRDFSMAELERAASKVKMPKTGLSGVETLPELRSVKSEPLPEWAKVFLIAKQSKHKEIEAAPDIVPLLVHIDRETSAPFALALVEGFLNSEQAASDRWALALGGLLGDKRVIPPLLSRIHDWCENSRHKLAEYAAQAIALLPGDEPLMVLDTLANRYRSKFKNVGAACAAAFNAAAAARGITPDELGDMVVPRFEFDDEGLRRFEWDGGGVSAELGPDFKLSWFDPETEKSWKSLPATAPASIKEEVTTLTKLLRETVKSQTARLEQALVRQRRWPMARWRELYETHPVLRSFASRMVWGIYDAEGKLLRTFRRYPNGLLADAAGALEELPESDTLIGMVHPLELDEPALAAWRAHLARMKVIPPFSQIDRPVERLDPMLGNRRQLALTDGKTLSAGTFKSRAEKRGWVRGSVVDAGGVTSYYKLYPGAGVEVSLPTEGLWVGFDPMDTVTLGSACFAKAGTIDRGSYIYDEPGPDDPRVLRFDQVPPVVYSETLADLQAITATKE